MTPDYENKCLVCSQTGGNFNIFTTYHISSDKEELYVEVIKNCYNIEITQETGVNALCPDCGAKLRNAYTFKNDIVEALQNLVAFQVADASTYDKEDPQIEYLGNAFETDYDINTVLNPETGQITYTLDKVDENMDTTENELETYLIDLENEVISKKCSKKGEQETEIEKDSKSKKAIEETEIVMIKENVPNNFDEEKPNKSKPTKARARKGKSNKVVEINNESNAVDKDTKTEEKIKKPKKNQKQLPFTLDPGQTQCKLCDSQHNTPRELGVHMNSHYPEHVCAQCGQVFASARKMKMHGYQAHVQGPIVCKYCDKEFTNANTRNAHMWRVHTKTDPFKCAKCGERFKTFLKRLRHIQEAHGEAAQYPCQYCDKKFAYAAYRTKHVRTVHLEVRPHKCRHCTYSFARRRELNAHLASKHGEGELKYQCDVCRQRFYFKTALRFHLNLHDNRYSCNQCDAKFNRISYLETHYKTHENQDLPVPDLIPGLDTDSLQLDEFTDFGLMDSLWVLNDIV